MKLHILSGLDYAVPDEEGMAAAGAKKAERPPDVETGRSKAGAPTVVRLTD